MSGSCCIVPSRWRVALSNFPTAIGDYKLTETIGDCGLAAIYKAWDKLGRDVAIKLSKQVGNDEGALQIFKPEAQIHSRLKHPNIVSIYQSGVDNGRPYIVMEYIEGRFLSTLIMSKQKLDLAEKLDIILQALEALKYLHNAGIIHRDIKPGNVMVVESHHQSPLVVKLTNFGIAELVSEAHHVAGTLPYMSPEHFAKRRTPWCDLFSIGVVCYELLTGGILPFASVRDDLRAAYNKLVIEPIASKPSGSIPLREQTR